MKRRLPLVLAIGLLAACGGSGDPAVAHVGDTAITQQQLDAVVAHFRSEAQLEGKDFPEDSSAVFSRLRNQLLALLVYRERLRQAAARLGVEPSDDEISKRLAKPAGGEDESALGGGDTFAHDSVVAQLEYEGIFDKVTRGITAPTAAELGAQRNKAMAAYLKRLERETTVSYEPGYAPGP